MKTFEDFTGESYSPQEVETAKQTLRELIKSDKTILQSVFIAGQIVHWSEMKEKYNALINALNAEDEKN